MFKTRNTGGVAPLESIIVIRPAVNTQTKNGRRNEPRNRITQNETVGVALLESAFGRRWWWKKKSP